MLLNGEKFDQDEKSKLLEVRSSLRSTAKTFISFYQVNTTSKNYLYRFSRDYLLRLTTPMTDSFLLNVYWS